MCAGVDEGDGFDCYGVPVAEGDPRTRRLTGVEKADVWRRLQLSDPQFYTLEERAHIHAGTFGIDGLTLYRTQTGNTAQALPTVNVIARNMGLITIVAIFTALAWYGSQPRRP